MDYYENHHAPLGTSLSPPMMDYRRNYPIWSSPDPSRFDVMTEIWHDARATFKVQIENVQKSPAREIIGEDEARFMNRDRQMFAAVDEVQQQITDRLPACAGHKMIRYIRSVTRDRTSDELQSAYESVDRLNAYRSAGVVTSSRNYVRREDEYTFEGGHHSMAPAGENHSFDIVEELWGADAAALSALDSEMAGKELEAGFAPMFGGGVIVREYRNRGGTPCAPIPVEDKVAS